MGATANSRWVEFTGCGSLLGPDPDALTVAETMGSFVRADTNLGEAGCQPTQPIKQNKEADEWPSNPACMVVIPARAFTITTLLVGTYIHTQQKCVSMYLLP